jgi:hypothetical protein
MASRTDTFPPELFRMPKKLPMKRKKLEGTCFESGQRIGRGEIWKVAAAIS